jgi:hypothetical protein
MAASAQITSGLDTYVDYQNSITASSGTNVTSSFSSGTSVGWAMIVAEVLATVPAVTAPLPKNSFLPQTLGPRAVGPTYFARNPPPPLRQPIILPAPLKIRTVV